MKPSHTIALRRFANDIYSRARHDADATVGIVLFTDPETGGKGVLHNVSGDRKEAGLVLLKLATEILKAEGVIQDADAPVANPAEAASAAETVPADDAAAPAEV